MDYDVGGGEPSLYRLEVIDVARRIELADPDDLVARYLAGESEKRLAEAVGVDRNVIRRLLAERNVPRRGLAEANIIIAANKTPEQHLAGAQAAHTARRGQRDSFDTKVLRAKTRQSRRTHIDPQETRVARWMRTRGVDVIQQQAIGPYNCDLGAEPVAVEIFGGNWHAAGRHLARFPERTRYLFDAGWMPVFVWATHPWPIKQALADHLVAIIEEARSDPPAHGEYRVVGGGGQDLTRPGLDLHELARKPPRR